MHENPRPSQLSADRALRLGMVDPEDAEALALRLGELGIEHSEVASDGSIVSSAVHFDDDDWMLVALGRPLPPRVRARISQSCASVCGAEFSNLRGTRLALEGAWLDREMRSPSPSDYLIYLARFCSMIEKCEDDQLRSILTACAQDVLASLKFDAYLLAHLDNFPTLPPSQPNEDLEERIGCVAGVFRHLLTRLGISPR